MENSELSELSELLELFEVPSSRKLIDETNKSFIFYLLSFIFYPQYSFAFEPSCLAAFAFVGIVCLLLACNNRAVFLQQGVAERSLLVFDDLPPVEGHAVVETFVATEVDVQCVAVGLHALYHSPICGYSRRLLRPTNAYRQ